ncbi:MAG: PDDEXK nuclease domain-containing protein [Gammaproteobacteria bacterium]
MNKLQEDRLYKKIAELIEHARQKVATTINLTMVHTYFEIGKMIVEDEQRGKLRAEYGKAVLKDLSNRLTGSFGKGFSVENLDRMRFFYKTYSRTISSTPLTKLENTKKQAILQIHSVKSVSSYSTSFPKFVLSWSHYLILMRIENPAERSFYELESFSCKWSLQDLKRQYHSSLYERLALSRNKNEVIKLANEGHVIEKPEDLLKNPLSLEFLGLEEHSAYSESDMERAIISKLNNFLLELGKGFLFEARQKRFTFDEQHFYVDLVFYNRLLHCYVLLDLKIDKLTHQDLGQMQMYVNYYDRFVKQDYEKPTIGILLCKKKNNMLVELTLPKNANIYASEYTLYLPDKHLLQQKVAEWIQEFKNLKGKKDL